MQFKDVPFKSIENQKGAIAVQSIWQYLVSFWFSTEHGWIVLSPFLLSANDFVIALRLLMFSSELMVEFNFKDISFFARL